MASMRDIKRRIKSVGSTQQITKAMNLVASSKLARAKTRFSETKPFFRYTRRAIAQIVSGSSGASHPYLQSREVKNVCVLVITGDRGLCGGYNTNVCKAALNAAPDADVTFVTIGGKGRDYLKHRNQSIAESYRGISEKPNYDDARLIGEKVLKMYDEGKVDEIYLAYTEFISTISNEPKVIKLMPLNADEFTDIKTDDKDLTLTIYEPGEEEVLDYIIPKYVNTILYGAMVESAACELSSRMTAMDSATENASEMIDDLNLLYNRVRQGAITQEITEIVGGSNALQG